MNITEIKQVLQEKIDANQSINFPFHMVTVCINEIKEKSNLELNVINYGDIYFYKVLRATQMLLNHLDLHLDFELNDEGIAIETDKVFEMYEEIYNMVRKESFVVFEELLDKEVSLAEREYIQLGLLENRVLNTLERLTTQVEKIVELTTDEKKFTKWLKNVKKNAPDLKGLFGKREIEEVEE